MLEFNITYLLTYSVKMISKTIGTQVLEEIKRMEKEVLSLYLPSVINEKVSKSIRPYNHINLVGKY